MIQNKALRIIGNLPKRSPTPDCREELGLLPLNLRRNLRKLQMTNYLASDIENLALHSSRNRIPRSQTSKTSTINTKKAIKLKIVFLTPAEDCGITYLLIFKTCQT